MSDEKKPTRPTMAQLEAKLGPAGSRSEMKRRAAGGSDEEMRAAMKYVPPTVGASSKPGPWHAVTRSTPIVTYGTSVPHDAPPEVHTQAMRDAVDAFKPDALAVELGINDISQCRTCLSSLDAQGRCPNGHNPGVWPNERPAPTGRLCKCGHGQALHFGEKDEKGRPRNDCFHPWGLNGPRCTCKLFVESEEVKRA